MVTLSACETGRNQILAGDELVGLCRGFLGAGTKSLVVSLWSVDDRVTTDLMVGFYQNLRDGWPINAALRAAQRAVRSRLHHPYFWAPFILMGKIDTTLRPTVAAASR
jgi:CHAT domain-containing protein